MATTDRSTTPGARLDAAVGILAAPLIVAGIVTIPSTETRDKTSEQLAAFYDEREAMLRISAVLLGLGMLAFFLFVARLVAAYRRSQDDETLPTLVVLGASGFTTLLLAGVAGFVATAYVGKLGFDVEAIQAVEAVGHMAFHACGIPLALFLAAASLTLRRGALAPRWLGAAGLVVAPLAFAHAAAVLERSTPDKIVHELGILGFHLTFVWLLVTGIALARRSAVRRPALQAQAATA